MAAEAEEDKHLAGETEELQGLARPPLQGLGRSLDFAVVTTPQHSEPMNGSEFMSSCPERA